MDVTKPYEFTRFEAMDVTKPYKFIGLGAMDVTWRSNFQHLRRGQATWGPSRPETGPLKPGPVTESTTGMFNPLGIWIRRLYDLAAHLDHSGHLAFA